MAGFNLGAGGNESFDLYLSGLTSHLAAERLAKDPAFMHTLFAGQWSEKDHAWHKPSSIVAPVKDAVKGFLGLHVAAWKPPDADAVESFLFHHVTVTQDRQTQIVTITLDYTDREWARKILAELHSTVDGILRTRALERANQMIGYLQERLQTITVSDYREALIQTLSDQEKVRMMASSNLAYVAETFGEATVSPEPTSPKAGFILALSALVGVFLGILVGMFLDRHGDSAADKLDLLKAHKNQSVFWVRIATLLGIYLRSGRAG
jgi:capsular polysaccharide biosynthesis protein